MKSYNLQRIDLDHVQPVTGHTKNYALIGDPVQHTWSPRIHNTFFSLYAIDAVYTALRVSPGALEGAFPLFRDAFSGINITIPHKHEVLPLLDEVDGVAKILGAVNTVKFEKGRAKGYNTDAQGFQYALLSEGIQPEGMMVAVLGGGGTARTVTYMLTQMHADVVVYTRNPMKSADLRDLGAKDVRHLVDFAGGFDMLVNTTPVGMAPDIRKIPVSAQGIASCGIVFDAIYNPSATMLLKQAVGRAYNGLSMLIYQAAHAQEIWHGKLASKDIIANMARCIREEMDNEDTGRQWAQS